MSETSRPNSILLSPEGAVSGQVDVFRFARHCRSSASLVVRVGYRRHWSASQRPKRTAVARLRSRIRGRDDAHTSWYLGATDGRSAVERPCTGEVFGDRVQL